MNFFLNSIKLNEEARGLNQLFRVTTYERAKLDDGMTHQTKGMK
jgi:hypothetical protein